MDNSESYSTRLAAAALELGALKVSPETPFTWASGSRMPVYNDNRLLLGRAEYRQMIAEGFQELLKKQKISIDVVAGTATAGIPHATTLANLLNKPLIYVRPTPKGHGLRNQIEGPLSPGQKVVVIEDLVSTGGSVLKVVSALRDAGAEVQLCLCIFTYGFKEADEQFRSAGCPLGSLLDFKGLIGYMRDKGALNSEQETVLADWSQEPFGWAQRHGLE